MASSLGYAMMNWTSEFARHAKVKRNKKKHSKNKENNGEGKDTSQNDINVSDIKHKTSKVALTGITGFERNEVEIQTEGKVEIIYKFEKINKLKLKDTHLIHCQICIML